MEKPLLSIIVPVYNMKDTLDRCVQSIVSQSFEDWEMIIVDDGSTDGSGAMCDECAKKEPRISVIHKENGGLSDARNAGLDIARGDYITFVDSDDYISEGIYKKMMSFMNDNENIGIVEFSVNNVGCERLDTNYEDKIYPDGESYWLESTAWNHSYAWNKIYRKGLIGRTRFTKGRVYEDLLFLPKILRKNPQVATSSFAGYNYVYRKGSISGTPNFHNLMQALRSEVYAAWTMRTFPWSKNGKNLYYYMCCRVYDIIRFGIIGYRRD